jgi:hypothetical protein
MTLRLIAALLALTTLSPACAADLIGRPGGRPPLVPFASATLQLNGNYGPIAILDETNVALKIVPAEAQDLNIAHQFDLICDLAPNGGIQSIGAYVDTRYHSIPVSVVEYKDFNPRYVKMSVDTIFLRNRINDVDTTTHRMRIEFFADPR